SPSSSCELPPSLSTSCDLRSPEPPLPYYLNSYLDNLVKEGGKRLCAAAASRSLDQFPARQWRGLAFKTVEKLSKHLLDDNGGVERRNSGHARVAQGTRGIACRIGQRE